jgi:hypothetical protein
VLRREAVFRILKFLVSLGCLAVLAWWALTVPLGDRTLFEHLRAIGDTKESQELVKGTRQKVTEVKRRIAGAERGRADAGAAPLGPPQEHLTQDDRQEMRRFINSVRNPDRVPEPSRDEAPASEARLRLDAIHARKK